MASDEEMPSEDGKPHAVITQDASDKSSSFAAEDDDVPLVTTATKQSKRAYNTITMGEVPKIEDSFDLPAQGRVLLSSFWHWHWPHVHFLKTIDTFVDETIYQI